MVNVKLQDNHYDIEDYYELVGDDYMPRMFIPKKEGLFNEREE